MVEERFANDVSNDNKNIPATAAKVQWVWDERYIDAPVLRWRDTGGDPDLDETLYFCNDANMNVTALIEPDGDVVERYVYDPYGKVTIYKADWTLQYVAGQPAGTASAFANDIRYCGYRFDPETGMYQVRCRYAHPQLGRFVSTDPVGYQDGANLYQYCRSSPALYADPLGTMPSDMPINDDDNLEGTIGHGNTIHNFISADPTTAGPDYSNDSVIGAGFWTVGAQAYGRLTGLGDAADFMRRYARGLGGTITLSDRLRGNLRGTAWHQRRERDLVDEAKLWVLDHAMDLGVGDAWQDMYVGKALVTHQAAGQYHPVVSWTGNYMLNVIYTAEVSKVCNEQSGEVEVYAAMKGNYWVFNRYSWVQRTGHIKGPPGLLQKRGFASPFYWQTRWQDEWETYGEEGDAYSDIMEWAPGF